MNDSLETYDNTNSKTNQNKSFPQTSDLIQTKTYFVEGFLKHLLSREKWMSNEKTTKPSSLRFLKASLIYPCLQGDFISRP